MTEALKELRYLWGPPPPLEIQTQVDVLAVVEVTTNDFISDGIRK